MNFADCLQLVEQGQDLEIHQMELAIAAMMDGSIAEDDMARFLLRLKEKGEAVDEVVGAAQAMRSRMTKIESDQENLVDTCGTGGDGSGTFNISTAAAIVAAAAGIPIAKHGNRAISSKSGSADALRELGVNVDASKQVVEACLSKVGLCFCFAPLFHDSVKNVGAARKKLGVPTIFNMLGPLCNPAGADYQVVGVGKPWQRDLIAAALQKLGTRRSVVVHGTDGLCEISNAAETQVSIVTGDSIVEETWTPEDFGLDRTTRESILAEDPKESVQRILQAISGEPSGARNIVVQNSAAAIWITDTSRSLRSCAELAIEQIESKKAQKMLEELVSCSQLEP